MLTTGVKDMHRPVLTILALLAMFLVPTDAWEASVSQNLSVTITSPTLAFYVAPNGSDGNPGNLASPFATVQACQNAMRNSTTKTCYIRAGTYTGNGNGYRTQTNGSITSAIYLTSADNGETWAEYPGDFPSNGVSSVIIDGGTTVSSPGVIGSQSCSGGVTGGFWIDGASNITVDRLQIRNFLWYGVAVHGGVAFEDIFPNAVGASNSNTVSNNTIHGMCGNLQSAGNGGAVIFHGNAQSNTATHNVVYSQAGMGIRGGSNSDFQSGALTDNISNTDIDHNVVYNTCTISADCGAVYLQDGNATGTSYSGGSPSTGITVNYNFVINFGPKGQAQVTNAFYDDDGASNNTKVGNIALSKGNICFFEHATRNVNIYGNICDDANVAGSPSTSETRGSYYAPSNGLAPSPQWSATWQQNIVLANSASCGSGLCASQVNWNGTWGPNPPMATQTNSPNFPGSGSHNNDYYNYGSGGQFLQSEATAQGDNNAQATAPAFSCTVSGTNTWGYVLANGSPVFSSPMNFPAQPSGWATTGFWGPPGYVLPHAPVEGTAFDTPSYIGSGVNGC
jgi:hypothetical protein